MSVTTASPLPGTHLKTHYHPRMVSHSTPASGVTVGVIQLIKPRLHFLAWHQGPPIISVCTQSLTDGKVPQYTVQIPQVRFLAWKKNCYQRDRWHLVGVSSSLALFWAFVVFYSVSRVFYSTFIESFILFCVVVQFFFLYAGVFTSCSVFDPSGPL